MTNTTLKVSITGDGVLFHGSPRLASLDDWVFALSHVYEKHQPLYSLLSDYWMHATNAAQNVAEEVRRGRPIDLIHKLGSAFAWCCTTAKQTLDTLEKLAPKGEEIQGLKSYGAWIAHKYPGRCHYCGWPACRCPSQRQVMEERNDADHPLRKTIVDQYQILNRERPTVMPDEIAKYQKTFVTLDLAHQIEEFDKIYQGANFERTFENICFHYLEEVGEVAREISWLEALQRIRVTEGLTKTYSPVFSDALRDNGTFLKIKDWAERTLASPSEGIELTRELLGSWADMSLDAQIQRLQYTYAREIMAELTDVFSWTTAIDYKVRQMCDRVHASKVDLAAYLCGSLADGGERLTYVAKVASDNYAQCAYCGKRFCEHGCVANRLIVEAVKKRVKQEVT